MDNVVASSSTSSAITPAVIIDPGLTEKACKACRIRKVKCDRKYPKCGRCTERDEECDFGKLIPITAISNNDEETRITALEKRMQQLEAELGQVRGATAASHSCPPPVSSGLTESIRRTFLEGAASPETMYTYIRERLLQQQSDYDSIIGANGIRDDSYRIAFERVLGPRFTIGERSLDWRLALPALGQALSIHLVDCFFESCCSFLPVFDSFHSRVTHYRSHLSTLAPVSQVAFAFFCAMGARASPHSAVLGIAAQDPNRIPTLDSVVAAGGRREQACRALLKRSLEMSDQFGITNGEASIATLETVLVMMQILIFQELRPVRSRSTVRIALGMVKDLLQESSPVSHAAKTDFIARLGLPLFLGDAVISAYAGKAPLITTTDIAQCFTAVNLYRPNFQIDSLALILDRTLPISETCNVTHEMLVEATTILSCWLGEAQRECGRIGSVRFTGQEKFCTEIMLLWSAIEQIHVAASRIQQLLISLTYKPHDCSSQACADLHLRYTTRIDRDRMDVTYVLHELIGGKVGTLGAQIECGMIEVAKESERKVRRELKLVAFYSQLLIASFDRHMTYHVFFQTELLSNWTEFALQRLGEVGGPETENLEVTETELDWLFNGLQVASFYHPCAEQRLYEFKNNRRGPRVANPDQPARASSSTSMRMSGMSIWE